MSIRMSEYRVGLNKSHRTYARLYLLTQPHRNLALTRMNSLGSLVGKEPAAAIFYKKIVDLFLGEGHLGLYVFPISVCDDEVMVFLSSHNCSVWQERRKRRPRPRGKEYPDRQGIYIPSPSIPQIANFISDTPQITTAVATVEEFQVWFGLVCLRSAS